MIRYYITDRRQLGGSLDRVLSNIERNAREGIDWIQIREDDLSTRALFHLALAAVERVSGTKTKILINSRADVAIAAGAHGVHLPAESIPAAEWRRVVPSSFLIGVSCHSPDELSQAREASFAVYGPVFTTPGKGSPVGLTKFSEAVAASPIPVLALGGVTLQNADSCIQAGAAGIAAIRMFQF